MTSWNFIHETSIWMHFICSRKFKYHFMVENSDHANADWLLEQRLCKWRMFLYYIFLEYIFFCCVLFDFSWRVLIFEIEPCKNLNIENKNLESHCQRLYSTPLWFFDLLSNSQGCKLHSALLAYRQKTLKINNGKPYNFEIPLNIVHLYSVRFFLC